MNGRVYDPVLGRFLSADPYVDSVVDSQSFNRYSYVSNNPLGYTDPSGFFKLKDVLKIVALVAVTVVSGGAALAALGVGGGGLGGGIVAFATGSFGGFANAVIAGAAAGFGSGFAASLLNGGSIGDAFKAGVIGAAVGGVSAGLAFGIGELGLSGIGKHLAHGVAQGGVTEAMGAEFRHGFYAAAFASAAAGPISRFAPGGVHGQVAAAAVVGGTASAIGGGKFANGAVSGAFTYLFNHAAHAVTEADVQKRAAAIRANMADFINNHPGETVNISRTDFDTLQLARAYRVRDAGLDKMSWSDFFDYLKTADTEFYRIVGGAGPGKGLRTSTVQFYIEGFGKYYGGEINYYMQGMAWSARMNSVYSAALPRAASIYYWNMKQGGRSNLQQIEPALRWASQGTSAYNRNIPK
jgi:hypothetical protein